VLAVDDVHVAPAPLADAPDDVGGDERQGRANHGQHHGGLGPGKAARAGHQDSRRHERHRMRTDGDPTRHLSPPTRLHHPLSYRDP
jgi:hypothetical protein